MSLLKTFAVALNCPETWNLIYSRCWGSESVFRRFPRLWPTCWSTQTGMPLQAVNLLDSGKLLTWFLFFLIVTFLSSNKQTLRVQLQQPVFVDHAWLLFRGSDVQSTLPCFFWNHQLHAFWLLTKSTARTQHRLHKSGGSFHWRGSEGKLKLLSLKTKEIQNFLEKWCDSLQSSLLSPQSWSGPSLFIFFFFKKGKRILAFLYGRTFQQGPSIKGWVLFQSQGICLQQLGLSGGIFFVGFFFFFFFPLSFDNVEVSGTEPWVPAVLGITQCFRAPSQ